MGQKETISVAAIDYVAERKRSGKHMQRGMMQHVINDTTSRDRGPMKNLPAVYTDPARFQAEKREIFLKLPLFVGLTPDIPNPGDKLLFDAVGPQILVVRNKDGKLNAFLNMCTHRASTLVRDCHHKGRMSCPFHGWTFDLDGKLIGLPGAQGFEGLPRESLSLIRVPVAEWHGLIFVKATPGSDEELDVAAHLGGFAPELSQLDFAHAQPVKSGRLAVEANWKYALDTYGEGYHFATLHPTTVGRMSLTDVMFYDAYPPHHRLGFPRREMKEDAKLPEEQWPEIPHGGVHLLYPNTIIQVEKMSPELEFVYGFYRMFPGETVDKAFTLMSTYRPAEVPADADDGPWVEVHDLVRQIVSTEDYSISAGGQRNLKWAPEDFRIVYGSNEIALQHFHRRLARDIGFPITDDQIVPQPE